MSQNVKITNLLVATWYAVGYYPKGTNKVRTNFDVIFYVYMYVHILRIYTVIRLTHFNAYWPAVNLSHL